MNDLISRQAAIEHLKKRLYETALNNDTELPYYEEMADNRVSVWLEEVPTVNAIPVVRCKECKHYREGKLLSPQKFCFRLRGRDGKAIGYNFAEDDFCSYGKMREDGCEE